MLYLTLLRLHIIINNKQESLYTAHTEEYDFFPYVYRKTLHNSLTTLKNKANTTTFPLTYESRDLHFPLYHTFKDTMVVYSRTLLFHLPAYNYNNETSNHPKSQLNQIIINVQPQIYSLRVVAIV